MEQELKEHLFAIIPVVGRGTFHQTKLLRMHPVPPIYVSNKDIKNILVCTKLTAIKTRRIHIFKILRGIIEPVPKSKLLKSICYVLECSIRANPQILRTPAPELLATDRTCHYSKLNTFKNDT